MGEIKKDANCGEHRDPRSEQTQFKARLAEFKILGRDDVEPTQSGKQADQLGQREPRLRSYCGWKLDAQIIYKCAAPARLKKPRRRQKSNCRDSDEREKNEIHRKAKRKSRWAGKKIETEQCDNDPFAPFLCGAAEKTGKNREERDESVAERAGRDRTLRSRMDPLGGVLH